MSVLSRHNLIDFVFIDNCAKAAVGQLQQTVENGPKVAHFKLHCKPSSHKLIQYARFLFFNLTMQQQKMNN